MDKKKIIQIAIIIAGLTASAVILYNGFFKQSSVPSNLTPNQQSLGAVGAASGKLLPYGNTLDFTDVLDKHNLQYGAVSYPQLDPAADVGVSADQLIKPQLPKTK